MGGGPGGMGGGPGGMTGSGVPPTGTMSLMEETGGPAADTPRLRLRRAGRVIVLDPEDRVLLFRYDDGPPNERHWCTPGGGLNDGEDYLSRRAPGTG